MALRTGIVFFTLFLTILSGRTSAASPTVGAVENALNQDDECNFADSLDPACAIVALQIQNVRKPRWHKKDISQSFLRRQYKKLVALDPYIQKLATDESTLEANIRNALGSMSYAVGAQLDPSQLSTKPALNKPDSDASVHHSANPGRRRRRSRRRNKRHTETLPKRMASITNQFKIRAKRVELIRRRFSLISEGQNAVQSEIGRMPNGPQSVSLVDAYSQSEDSDTKVAVTFLQLENFEAQTVDIGHPVAGTVNPDGIPLGEEYTVSVKKDYKQLYGNIKAAFGEIEKFQRLTSKWIKKADVWLAKR